jgi:hypothetical protein
MPQQLLFVALSLLLLPSNTKFPTPSPLIRDLILTDDHTRRNVFNWSTSHHTPQPFSFPPEVLIALLHNFLPVGNAYFNSLHSHWNAAWRECRSGSTCNVRNDVDEDIQNVGFESLH